MNRHNTPSDTATAFRAQGCNGNAAPHASLQATERPYMVVANGYSGQYDAFYSSWQRAVLLILMLVCVLSLSQARAQLPPLPEEPRFDQLVGFQTASDGESLSSVVTALARSIGLTPVLDNIPDETIFYDIGEPKPFRQVWNLVLALNQLDYVLQANDVVVVGTAETIAKLTGAPLDPEGSLERAARLPLVRRAYALSNAEADQLSAVLRATVITEETTSPVAGNTEEDEGETSITVRSQDLSIAADNRTNQIIVTASEPVQEEIARLIQELDLPQRQVNIQVRIQEIDVTSAMSFGINLAAGFGNFAVNTFGSASSSLEFIFDPQRAISGLNIGAVLDTLESQNLSRRIDDTMLTALDNGQASLQSGGRININIPSGDNPIQEQVEYGVVISVSPRIAADGTITIDVVAEVDDLLTSIQQIISSGGQVIERSTRNVSSTVTVRPGQTVVLGGLLQNTFSNTTNRVPILGSLPIVGNLFRSTTIEESNIELLLVVTATIVE